MTRIKLTFVTLLMATLAIAIGCNKSDSQSSGSGSSSASNGGKLKLGFLVKQPEEPWFQLEWKFADEAAKKYDFDLVKIGAADGDKVLAAIDNLRSQGAKGLSSARPTFTSARLSSTRPKITG